LEKGRKLIYQAKENEIFHIYESGYCELKRDSGFDFLLVSMEDVKINGYFILKNEN
jgi:hypothetical protein